MNLQDQLQRARDYRTYGDRPTEVIKLRFRTNGFPEGTRSAVMVYGYGVRTTTAQGDPVVVLWSDGDWRESTSAVYLLDDGHSVTPHWCSGGSAGGGIWLQPFPLDFNADGSPRMTGDGVRNANGMPSRPVDMSTWMLAPSRCYHVKVSTDVRDLDQHGRELPLPD